MKRIFKLAVLLFITISVSCQEEDTPGKDGYYLEDEVVLYVPLFQLQARNYPG